MFNFTNKKGNLLRGRKSAEIRRPKLLRLDAVKNIDYEASSFASDDSNALQATRSLDFSPEYSSQSSFRIGGSREGEVEHLYESLGLSGPEDFAIPIAAWEASLKFRSSSDVLPRTRLLESEETDVSGDKEEESGVREEERDGNLRASEGRSGVRDVGIKGPRPPSLTPPQVLVFPVSDVSVSSVLPLPPSMSVPVVDRGSSIWDLVRSFAPGEENEAKNKGRLVDSDEEEDDDDEEEEEEEDEDEEEEIVLERETSDGAGSFCTSIDDDSSSTTTEFVISPNGRFKKKIKSWLRGPLLGSGSFGTVYEGVSE